MKHKEKKFSWRKLFNDIHLWMGIGSGLILFLVCLSGTLYVFMAEVEKMIEPEKYRIEVKANAQRLPAEKIIAKIRQEVGGSFNGITIPHDPGQPYTINFKQSEEDRRGTNYLVDPYTATLKGTTESPAAGFFMFMFRMHRWLLMDTSIGRVIVGIATIIFVFLLLTGLVLWWPKKLKNIRQGLVVKTSASWKRINHDLHNALGFYAMIMLLIMALTGLCWSFEWYRNGLSDVLGAEVFGGRNGKPMTSDTSSAGAKDLKIDDFIRLTHEVLPYDGDYNIAIPTDEKGVVVVRKNRAASFFALSVPDKVEIDQYSGSMLKVEKFSDKPLNEQIAAAIKPIHTGEIFGTFSKIIYFISCLIATSLPVTGTIIWINKLKKKAKKRKKRNAKVMSGGE